MPRQARFFTPKEIDIMLDHNVPDLVARQRINKGWDRKKAITSKLVYKTARERNALAQEQVQVQEVQVIDRSKINWKV